MTNIETMKFDAEIGKVLKLMIHSLYTNKDIFLRELISNASDACDKLRYLAVTNADLLKSDLHITLQINEKERTVIITDNGIGMSKQDLIENLGTIARSGTQGFLENLSGDKEKDLALIGQFGVGFYSAFMVADNVSVISRKAGEEQSYKWCSKGEGEFTIEEVESEFEHGTKITLHLKEGEDDYLEKFRLRHIVSTYSDHISFPIEFIDENNEIDVVNKASALWTRNKNDITEEQYQEFYRHVAHSPDKPWLIMHNKNEGAIEYTNLLFVPSSKPFDLFHPDRKARVKLYVKRVFISEDLNNLIPSYLRFMRGVVDSEDLPLNISRETLQHNHMIDKIRKSITTKFISELKKKKTNEYESYLEFWENFGPVFKEGLCESYENRESLLEVCLFKSALTGKLISLDDYIASMKEDQEHIYYYLSGENKRTTSPQIEGFLKNNIDVLILQDLVDDFWVNVENKYKDKEFKSVTRADIELDNKEDDSAPKEESTLEYFKNILGPLVKDVRFTNKLVDSPACLAVDEGAMDIRMERFLLDQKQLQKSAAKILEINASHPIIKKITQNQDSEDTSDWVRILFDQACILENEPINDIEAYASRVNKMLEKVA